MQIKAQRSSHIINADKWDKDLHDSLGQHIANAFSLSIKLYHNSNLASYQDINQYFGTLP
jgi:hypothetical protein